ncbi:MAG: DUF190 domain-containing protein [Mariprofundaceae bacterium]
MPLGLCLRIYISESDQIDGSPAAESILMLCRDAGLQAVSVLRGIEGLGQHGVHSASFLELSSGLPLMIEVIDSEQRIKQALSRLQSKLPDAFMATWPVELIQNPAE